jgi:hypothetical protein
MQSFLQKDNFINKFCKGKQNVRLCMVEIQKIYINIKTSTKIKNLHYLHIYSFLEMPTLTHALFHSSSHFS